MKLKLKQPKVLAAVHPNAGLEAQYRRELRKLIRQMHESVTYWVRAAYRANEPLIAQDELPAAVLRRVLRRLTVRWQKRFNDAAPRLAKYFATAIEKRSKSVLQGILDDAGFTVDFKMTRTMQDVMNATIAEQVGLIRSIPQKYFTDVEGAVMRSVQAGRDLGPLTDHLQKTYGVSFRRAALIARDQNNKATATMTRVRQQEMGITEAVWLHSHGGKEPRPTHLANSGKKYDVKKGWYDPDAHGKGKGDWIFPGQLINCRCVSKPVIPGFS